MVGRRFQWWLGLGVSRVCACAAPQHHCTTNNNCVAAGLCSSAHVCVRRASVVTTVPVDPQDLRALALSPRGDRVAVGGETSGVTIIRAGDLSVQSHLTDTAFPIFSLAFSPDGQTLVAGACATALQYRTCYGGEILYWENGGQSLRWRTLDFASAVRTVAFAPDGSVLAGGCSHRGFYHDCDSGDVHVLDAATGAVTGTYTVSDLELTRLAS